MSWRHRDEDGVNMKPHADDITMETTGDDKNPINRSGSNSNMKQQQQQQQLRHPSSGPLQSIEGWIVFVTGVHEEAQEDDLMEACSEFGEVRSVVLNLDRRTGLAKGYALVEFNTLHQAQDAINALHGAELLGQTIGVDWAFVKPAVLSSHRAGNSGGGGGSGNMRSGGGAVIGTDVVHRSNHNSGRRGRR